MKKKDLFKRTNAGFHDQQKDMMDLFNANGSWKIDATKLADATTKQSDYEGKYLKITNPNTRTRSDVLAHNKSRDSYKGSLRDIIRTQVINNPQMTDADRQQLGIAPRDTVRSQRPVIDSAPFVNVKALQGGQIQVDCRVQNDNSRSSKHPNADLIEATYSIGTLPASPAACTQTVSSTRARFIIQLNIADAGKMFYGFFRFKNNSSPEKSGPYSTLQTVVIPN